MATLRVLFLFAASGRGGGRPHFPPRSPPAPTTRASPTAPDLLANSHTNSQNPGVSRVMRARDRRSWGNLEGFSRADEATKGATAVISQGFHRLDRFGYPQYKSGHPALRQRGWAKSLGWVGAFRRNGWAESIGTDGHLHRNPHGWRGLTSIARQDGPRRTGTSTGT
jgi:hypothetical protein